MRVKRKQGYIAVYGNSFPIRIGKFLIGGKQPKAAALPPFMFFYDESCEEPHRVNHELIHFIQATELLIVGAWILWLIEYLYARIFLKMSAYDTYHYCALEQEAYLNDSNPDYLKNRKLFSIFKYIKNKKSFTVDKDGVVTIIH